MQNGENNNALAMVSDYVLPAGMIDFNSPANMVMEYMKLVKEKPDDKELKETLRIVTDAAKVVVTAGMGQVQQGEMMVKLLEVNKKLRLIK